MSKPILCLDFDGVLHSYTSGWQGAAVVADPPVPGAIDFLYAASRTFKVAIFSSRSHQPGGIQAMQEWLWRYWRAAGIEPDPFDAIDWPTEKPPALVTLDDRAMTFDGTWPAIETLLVFKPWNKR